VARTAGAALRQGRHHHLDGEIIAEAARTHPALATPDCYYGSPSYRGHAHAKELFAAELPLVGGVAAETVVADLLNVEAAARSVVLQAASAGLWSHQIIDLADAVRGLTVTSLRRGAELVRVRLWTKPDVLICDVIDDTIIDDLLIGRRAAPPPEQDSIWFANQRCDLVQARSSSSGTTIRLHMRNRAGRRGAGL